MSGGAHDPVDDRSAFAALPPELLLSILQAAIPWHSETVKKEDLGPFLS